MIRIVADEKIPLLKGILEPYADVIYTDEVMLSRKLLRHADALLIRTVTTCDADLLEGSEVKFIGSSSAGFDHIDTLFCEKHGIHWVNAPGCNAVSVSQYACSALLSIAQKTGESLQDKTLGIVGVGNVGRRVQKLAETIGLKVLLNDPPRERSEGPGEFSSYFDTVERADILTFHVPLIRTGQDKTYHMFDQESLSKMKEDSWLINSSRGEVIRSADLKTALVSGRSPKLILDVWENEPRIDLELLPYVFIATPHIAGYSLEGRTNGTAMIIRELAHFFDLPLRNWNSEMILVPEKKVIDFDGKERVKEDILREIVFSTYSIQDDDYRFRSNPKAFELYRANYPVRREFSAYHLRLKNTPSKIQELLSNIGFSIERVE
jgi:erythronate-4-phosphate dehydrogenase